MIGYQLTDEHEELRATVAEFAREVVAPVIADYYERCEFPYDIVARMGKLGLFGLPFPEEYGGMGGDIFALCLAIEELARVDSSVAITLEAAVALGAMPLYRFGTRGAAPPLAPRTVRRGAAGRVRADRAGRRVGHPGRDADHRADGGRGVGHRRLEGVHHQRGHLDHVAGDRAGPHRRGRAGRRDISAIIVPAGTPGLTVGGKYSKVGWSASDTRELAFDGCRVPADHLLGERGRGYAQFLATLDEGRVAIASLAVGLAAGCVTECLRHVADRTAFGHHLGHYQAIQFKLADMEARVHTARLAWYDAAARLAAGQTAKKQASIAKLVASNAAMDNARDATQIFGGYGYMNEYPVARFYRDAKVLEIGEGTSEVQRMIIAREMGLPR